MAATVLLVFTLISSNRTLKQSSSTEELNQTVTNALYDAALKNNWDFDNEASREEYVDDFIEEVLESKKLMNTDLANFDIQREIPAMALTTPDGFYICHLDTYYRNDGEVQGTMFKKNFTTKQPYTDTVITADGEYLLLMSFNGNVEVLTPTDMTLKGSREEIFNKLGRPSGLSFLNNSEEYYNYLSAKAVEQIVKYFENILKDHSYGNNVDVEYSVELPLNYTNSHRSITNQTALVFYQKDIDTNGQVWTNVYSVCASELTKGAKYGIIKSGNGLVYYNTKDGVRAGTLFVGSDSECAAWGATPESY